MAFSPFRDINLIIFEYVKTDVDTILVLSLLNRASHSFIKKRRIYREICTLTHYTRAYMDNWYMIKKTYTLNLPILFELKIKMFQNDKKIYEEIIKNAFQSALYDGYIEILRIALNSGVKILHCDKKLAVEMASKNGNADILELFKNHGFNFRKFRSLILPACGNGHINVLEWFKNNGFRYEFAEAVNKAAEQGKINVLEWYKNMGYCHNYMKLINIASEYGNMELLEWIKKNCLKFVCNKDTLFLATSNGHVNVLDMFYKHGEKIKFNDKIIVAIVEGGIETLKWYMNHDFKMTKTQMFNMIKIAADHRETEIIKWLVENMEKFRCWI